MSRRKRRRLSLDGRSAITTAQDEEILQDNDCVSVISKSKSLFVHSLPAEATTQGLTEHFSQSFPIKHATVVMDSATRKTKGYGFVTFADAEDLHKARNLLNGSLYQGKSIKVDIAEPRHRVLREADDTLQIVSSGSKKKRSQEPRPADSRKLTKLIVRNLPWSVKESDQLALLFRRYGKVKYATVPKKPSGLSAGYGFITLHGEKNGEEALKAMNGQEVDGRQLAVDFAVDKAVWETLLVKERDEMAKLKLPEATDTESSIKSEGFDITSIPSKTSIENLQIQTFKTSKSSIAADEETSPSVQMDKNRDTSSTVFIRNVSFDTTDEMISEHFTSFGPVRYGRVVLDLSTEKSRGTAFVCFYNPEDAKNCLRSAPRPENQPSGAVVSDNSVSASMTKNSLLENTRVDPSGKYTLQGRVLQVSQAVDRGEAKRLAVAKKYLRDSNESDKRRLYLLSEGTISANTSLHSQLSPSELRSREDSAKQRQTLLKSNPALHVSLTRLSVRNIPRSMTSKELKEIARQAIVGFASDVKAGARQPLSKEELARGSEEMRIAEKARKAKAKGIVKQAKIVFEGLEGGKVREDSGAGRSRGYGFIEYASHRCALMGLRWLNGRSAGPQAHAQDTNHNTLDTKNKRLIVEFAIENAQVVMKRWQREARARGRSQNACTKQSTGQKLRAGPIKEVSDTQRSQKEKENHGIDAGPAQSRKSKSMDQANGTSEALVKRQHVVQRKRKLRRSKKPG